MASPMQKRKRIKKNKKVKMGKERKRLIRKNGTTPTFPVHKEEKKSVDTEE